jgi:hypothetical protein
MGDEVSKIEALAGQFKVDVYGMAALAAKRLDAKGV